MPTPRPFLLAILLLVGGLSAPRAVPAQAPLGQVAASFDFGASRLLADPVRPRMYAAVPKTNSVNVIDTHTLQIIASVYVGSHPVDLSISPDGNTLYAANRDSTISAIGALDLNTLQALPAISLPASPYSVAAGLGGRLYVSTGDLLQVDAATGAVQAKIVTGPYYSDGYLQISPDARTLYVGTSSIQSFDVSTPAAAVLQANGDFYSRGVDSLRISHDGKSICGPDTTYSNITLYSATDLSAFYGRFDLGGDDAGPLAFSNDDALLYEVTDHFLRVYDTHTFVQTARLLIPIAAGYDPLTHDENYSVYDLATDSTGSFLFVSQNNSVVGDNTVVLTTGHGTLTPPGALPSVRLTSDTPQLDVGSGARGRYTLTRTGDLSQSLTVSYTLRTPSHISAYDNGFVFKFLPGTKTFKAGHATVGIRVVPQQSSYYFLTPYTLTMKLQASGFYSVDKAKAKMTFVP